jgi:hypothetical protein
MADSLAYKVELFLTEEEWLDWNRAALNSKRELPSWVRMVVNAARAAPPAPRKRPNVVYRTDALVWADEESRPTNCEYCGSTLDWAWTRRRRFCADECRVRAWRARKRQAAVDAQAGQWQQAGSHSAG